MGFKTTLATLLLAATLTAGAKAQDIPEDLNFYTPTQEDIFYGKLKTLLTDAVILSESNKRKDLEKTDEKLNQILDMEQTVDYRDSTILSEAYFIRGNMSLIYHPKHPDELKPAIRFYTLSLIYNLNNKWARINCLINMALKDKMEGNMEEALSYYAEAVKLDPLVLNLIDKDMVDTYKKLYNPTPSGK